VLLRLNDDAPRLADGCWVAETAVLVGRVRVGPRSSVWYQAVLRAEYEDITIGADSNIQDGCVLHVDPGTPLTVGDRVSVGHNAVLHGCTIGDDVLVGMNATVLNGARIGDGCLIAAGALVSQGMEVPPGSLVAGVPGTVKRPLRDGELDLVRANATVYVDLAGRHADGARPVDGGVAGQ
jgi:carbonic anhydrase/acetyltransferase-like protein (isoleucine patch superfamily)